MSGRCRAAIAARTHPPATVRPVRTTWTADAFPVAAVAGTWSSPATTSPARTSSKPDHAGDHVAGQDRQLHADQCQAEEEEGEAQADEGGPRAAWAQKKSRNRTAATPANTNEPGAFNSSTSRATPRTTSRISTIGIAWAMGRLLPGLHALDHDPRALDLDHLDRRCPAG